jgi:hypothetical protein
MSRAARRKAFDQRILAAYNLHDDDDISTERLLAMVCDDCGCDVSRVVEALRRDAEADNKESK